MENISRFTAMTARGRAGHFPSTFNRPQSATKLTLELVAQIIPGPKSRQMLVWPVSNAGRYT